MYASRGVVHGTAQLDAGGHRHREAQRAWIYDYALGGSHNFAADRRLFAQVVPLMPDLVAHARSGRAFMRRVVGFCVETGIRLIQRGGVDWIPRSQAEVRQLFAGFKLVEPGLVWAHEWRPDPPHDQADDLDRPFMVACVGRKL